MRKCARVNMHTHIYIHTYINTCVSMCRGPCMHAYINTHIHTCSDAFGDDLYKYLHSHTNIYAHKCKYSRVHAHMNARMHAELRANIYVPTHMRVCAFTSYTFVCIHTYIHTYIHIRTHKYIHAFIHIDMQLCRNMRICVHACSRERAVHSCTHAMRVNTHSFTLANMHCWLHAYICTNAQSY